MLNVYDLSLKDPYYYRKLVHISFTFLDFWQYACKHGWLQELQKVFVNIPEKDAVLWNALISAFADENLVIEGFESMNQMQPERSLPMLLHM